MQQNRLVVALAMFSKEHWKSKPIKIYASNTFSTLVKLEQQESSFLTWSNYRGSLLPLIP